MGLVVPDFAAFEYRPVGAGGLKIFPGFKQLDFEFE